MLETADRQEGELAEAKSGRLKDKIAAGLPPVGDPVLMLVHGGC
jgi:hypothetical protein